MHATILMEQILVLFIVMLIGFIARRRNILSKELNKGLTDILLTITVPALIISSFHFKFSEALFKNALIVIVASFIIHIVSYFLGFILFRHFTAPTRKVLTFTTVFSNCAFMGFPVIESIYGKTGIFYGSLYIVAFNLLVWTVGIMIFTEKPDRQTLRKALLSPGIIAVGMGMLLFVGSINLPQPLFRAITLTGSMTTPLSMIIVGSILAECDWKQLFSGFSVYYGAFVRLIALPLITFTVMKLIQISDPTLLGVCVLSVAMPAAAITALFAEKYEGDALLASRSVFITTALSILTIPLILTLLIA